MSSPNPNLPLPQFLSSTLQPLLPIFNDSIPSSTTSAQSTLSTAADNLYLIGRMMSSLGLYSENEDVDELGERELVFMAAAWVLGEVEGRRGVTRLEGGGGRQEYGGEGGVSMDGRMGAVKRSDTAYQSFVHLLMSYKILSPEEISEAQSLAQNVGAPTPAARVTPRDPARRREEKIRAYKREKELRGTIAAAIPGDAEPSSHPLAFILPLLPSPTPTSQSRSSTSVNDENEVPVLRSIILLLLRLLYTLTLSSLSSNQMELELLSHAPVDPDAERRRAAAAAGQDRSDSTDSDNTWRLDRAPAQRDARMGGLISGGGKVLRPFTILPSTSAMSDRERLKSEVFRSGHRLPSMTVDEYLEEEMRRGGIISGGGQASADAPTTSELLQLASENDGTYDAEEAEEQKRQKDENWARFTDENRKGAGNTMNRG